MRNGGVIEVGDTVILYGGSSKMTVAQKEEEAGPWDVSICVWHDKTGVPHADRYSDRILKVVKPGSSVERELASVSWSASIDNVFLDHNHLTLKDVCNCLIKDGVINEITDNYRASASSTLARKVEQGKLIKRNGVYIKKITQVF